ncbi:uncharacterized protein BCR38DRAFT_485152 [Pseudomassariella vexata]|uniref:Uncharacterized protein n=1 Tax=Pseudomassariella vexata TaxID=1141098 RepID=A0A1Y2DXL7_9PEZI|nr:uncharacterized protein BCR38DRAFT_485152 [Pseudomassariella vexata]ORY64011.1 hypothetical protein BCR38DRAFT_485152 [Pseudomassariella vexata]
MATTNTTTPTTSTWPTINTYTPYPARIYWHELILNPRKRPFGVFIHSTTAVPPPRTPFIPRQPTQAELDRAREQEDWQLSQRWYGVVPKDLSCVAEGGSEHTTMVRGGTAVTNVVEPWDRARAIGLVVMRKWKGFLGSGRVRRVVVAGVDWMLLISFLAAGAWTAGIIAWGIGRTVFAAWNRTDECVMVQYVLVRRCGSWAVA